MKTVTREDFVGHFSVTIHVCCLSMWSRRQKEAPIHISRAIFESINTCNGEIAIASDQLFGPHIHRCLPAASAAQV